MKEIFSEFLEFINDIVKKFCIILTGSMTFLVLLQVVMRLLVRVLPIKVPNWTEELSRYMMIYIAFVGASNGIREWSMVGVDFLLNKFPNKARFAMNLAIRVTILAFWIVIVYLGINIFPKVGIKQFSASMGFPLFYAQLSIIIGGVICALQTIGQTVKLITEGGEVNA